MAGFPSQSLSIWWLESFVSEYSFLLVLSSCKWTGRIQTDISLHNTKKDSHYLWCFPFQTVVQKIKNERPLLCVVSGSVNRQMHRLGEIEMTKMVNWIKWIQTSSSIFHAYIYGKSGPGRPGCRASGRLGHWVARPWAGAGGRAPALAKPTSSTEGCGI